MEILPLISIFLIVLGGIGIILHTDYLDKIIMFSFLEAGLVGIITSYYYLDVAIIFSILVPVSATILLLGSLKYTHIKGSKKKYGSKLPILAK
ncbi:DUF2108 domain-containing protein [Methanothermococcus sp. SCGC AD-155-M21]|nr:DUF2108 domain-containing protein [Methanothermococcus sp. SCGC AD-155-M21]